MLPGASSLITFPLRLALTVAGTAASAAHRAVGVAGTVIEILREETAGQEEDRAPDGGPPTGAPRPEPLHPRRPVGARQPVTPHEVNGHGPAGAPPVQTPPERPRPVAAPKPPTPAERPGPPADRPGPPAAAERAATAPAEPAPEADPPRPPLRSSDGARPTPVDPANEPAHVSEEPVVVAEVADRGAEDGPGASLRVAEPWEGYGKMKADQVIARIADASREELAVIELYEGMHRRRKGVLSAVERQLKAASPPSSHGR